VLKAREKHTHALDSECSDGVLGIVDTDTDRMTASMLVNELVMSCNLANQTCSCITQQV